MPRAFFEKHVRPNYDAWMVQPLGEHLAMNAVADANNMAARVYRHWENVDRAKVYGANNEGQYRNTLAAKECADFGLVRDVADAHKHVVLHRPARRITRAIQTILYTLGWSQGRWDEGGYDGAPQLVVTLDDGSKRPLTAIMGNVMKMWERLLSGWGL